MTKNQPKKLNKTMKKEEIPLTTKKKITVKDLERLGKAMEEGNKSIKKEIEEKFRKRFGRFYCDAVKQEVDMEGNLIVGSDEIEEWIINLLKETIERFIEETLEQAHTKIWEIEKESGGISLAESAKFDIYYQTQIEWLKRRF